MGRLAKNYIYNIIYQIFILLVPLITAPYLARVLGANNLGIYSYINSYGSIVSTLSLLGIYNYGVRELAYVRDSKEQFNKTFWEINVSRIFLGVIGCFLYFAFAKPEYYYYLFLYLPWLIAGYIDLSWVFVAVENMGPAVLKNFIAKLITVIGIFVLVKQRNQVWIYILLLAISTLAANLSLIPQVCKYVEKPSIDIHDFKKHIKGTLTLFLPQIASILYTQMDKVMMEGINGNMAEISCYDQAGKIVNIPMTFITVMSTVMMPRIANEFAKGNKQEVENLLAKACRFSLMLSFPLIVGLSLIAPKFIPWFLGKEFSDSSTAIIILSPMILSNALSGISGSQYFVATNQMAIVISSNVTGAVLNIIVNALLIPKYGYVGAAIASVLASYVIVVMQFAKLHHQMSIASLLKSLPVYLLDSIIMGFAIYFVSRNMSANVLSTLIQVIVGVAFYALLLLIQKDQFLLEIIRALKSKIRRKNVKL